MLVCPQCQFENPNTNKFCQRCGNSLTHKTCHECGTQVPINAETCHHCGAFTGTVWRAIISKDRDSLIPQQEVQATPLEESDRVVSETNTAEKLQIEMPSGIEGEQSQAETSPLTKPVPSSESESQRPEHDPEADTPPFAEPAESKEIPDEDVTQPLSTPRRSSFDRGAARNTP